MEIVFKNIMEICQDNQEIEVNDNKAVVMVQKQPTQTTSTQKQAVKNNWFCIVIQVNGKIQETNKGD